MTASTKCSQIIIRINNLVSKGNFTTKINLHSINRTTATTLTDGTIITIGSLGRNNGIILVDLRIFRWGKITINSILQDTRMDGSTTSKTIRRDNLIGNLIINITEWEIIFIPLAITYTNLALSQRMGTSRASTGGTDCINSSDFTDQRNTRRSWKKKISSRAISRSKLSNWVIK